MVEKLQLLRGTKDLLPDQLLVHNHIIDTAKSVSALYGYSSMTTPIIENVKVFDRTLGATSDVISKEMYAFHDKSNDLIALRPEFTAGIIRSFISNNLHNDIPLKYFSSGPVFRYDRPQAGRQRQFHQLNFEHIGVSGPYSDAELIRMAQDILERLGIADKVIIEINSLGCKASMAIYQQKLIDYFMEFKSKLSEDSIKRLDKNPMRVLDSKDEVDKNIAQNAPKIFDCYTDSARKYFDEVLKYLDLLNIKYSINPRLVRGLDYYCHTAFEFVTQELGAQSTILAGGRYDHLSKIMGGPDVPAIGFASGIERLALMRQYNITRTRPCYIFPISKNNLDSCLILANKLRQNDVVTIIDDAGKIPKRMQRAIENNANYVIFIGDDEQKNNIFKLKHLDTTQEYSLNLEELIEIFDHRTNK